MELGEKLRLARLEAGLSQRQLAGDTITRNMLSLIENGSARPSMDTLRCLAGRLGKPVSFFLEEDALLSPNQGLIFSVRQRFDAGDFAGAAEALKAYRSPDPVFDRERDLLWALAHLHLAEDALAEGRLPYARKLLEEADIPTAYCRDALMRRRLLLLGALPGQQVASRLPSLDQELLLRAKEALAEGQPDRAGRLLDAAQEQTGREWNLLRGKVFLASRQYREAAGCFHRCGEEKGEILEALEECYRELGDYKTAYLYATKQR